MFAIVLYSKNVKLLMKFFLNCPLNGDLPSWEKIGMLEGLENKDKMLLSLMFDRGYILMKNDGNNDNIPDDTDARSYFIPLLRKLYITHFKSSYKEFVRYNNVLKREMTDIELKIDYNKVFSIYVPYIYEEFKHFYITTNRFKDFIIEIESIKNDYEVDALLTFCKNVHVIPNDIWA